MQATPPVALRKRARSRIKLPRLDDHRPRRAPDRCQRSHAVPDLGGALDPTIGIVCQRAGHQGVDATIEAAEPRWRLEAAQRQPAGEQLVDHHPEREDVGAVVDGARRFQLLGRHVHRRAEHAPGPGQP